MSSKNLYIKRELEAANQKYDGDDGFLGKDVLSFPDQMSSSRNIMTSLYTEQHLVLLSPEIPRVFTNYENQVGKYSSSYRKTDQPMVVIAKISKFKDVPDQKYILVVLGEDGVYDIIEKNIAENVTENFGYVFNTDNIDLKTAGETIPADEVLYACTSYDEHMNFRYGTNLKTINMIHNDTIEDAIWCSEVARDKLEATYIEEVKISLNNNDILCNLYGDDKEYRAFPDLLEEVRDRTLAARRRIVHDYVLFDLKSENLREPNYSSDTIFQTDGIIIDINIYSNQKVENMSNHPYNRQIMSYLKQINDYYERIVDILEPIVLGGKKYTEDLGYIYKRAKDICDPNVRWKDENDFDNMIIEFKLLRRNKLKIGSKVCGRHGDKGVISKISPVHEMPVNQYGEHVDIVFNALGISNRLIPSAMFEVEINFFSDNIVRLIKDEPSIRKKRDILFEYIGLLNKDQHRELESYYSNLDKEGRRKFLKEIEEDGIFVHRPPFFHEITLDKVRELYKHYGFEPYEFTYNGKKILNKLIMGDKYILRLKHEPAGKFSARSTSFINYKNVPSKSNNHKEHQTIYSQTPIRIGEMEIPNLGLSMRPDLVRKLILILSSNESARQKLVETYLIENPLDIESIQINESENYNKQSLDILLKGTALTLMKEDPEKVEKKKKKKKKSSK